MSPLRTFLQSRLWSLILKEIQQILRNRQIIFLLLFPPTVQLLVFGLALNPEVTHLSLSVVDYSQSPASREFIATLTANDSVVPAQRKCPGAAGKDGAGVNRVGHSARLCRPADR